MQKIRAIVYGAGQTGKDLAEYMTHNGVQIVGAIGNEQNIGRDLGDIIGVDEPLNVELKRDADEVLCENQADIALVAIASTLEKTYDCLEKCLKAGINVITVGDEAHYPWHTSPEKAARLDKLARENGVTITGGGFQDGYWVHMVTTMTGAALDIDRVSGTTSFNIDDYGPAVAKHYQVGKPKSDVEAHIEEGDFPPRIFRLILESQVAKLGMSVERSIQRPEPIVAEREMHCEALDRAISVGQVIGIKYVIEVDTDLGIDFRGEEIAKIYEPGEADINEWRIEGTPDIHIKNKDVPSRIATSTQAVNRIPDVIDAKPGYRTLDEYESLAYRPFSLENYVNSFN